MNQSHFFYVAFALQIFKFVYQLSYYEDDILIFRNENSIKKDYDLKNRIYNYTKNLLYLSSISIIFISIGFSYYQNIFIIITSVLAIIIAAFQLIFERIIFLYIEYVILAVFIIIMNFLNIPFK